MALSFSATDAKKLIRKNESLLRELDRALKERDKAGERISAATEAVRELGVEPVLRELKVEELKTNRELRMIRPKVLRDHGLTTVADIWLIKTKDLMSMEGIGEETAYIIKNQAKKLAEKVRPTVKLRLNYDERTKEADELVALLADLRVKRGVYEALQSVAVSTDAVRKHTADLKKAVGTFTRLFAGKTVREQAETSWVYLTAFERNGGLAAAEKALAELRTAAVPSDAWEDFALHSIEYYTMLEGLVPGLVESQDEVSGLPDEMAASVGAELPDLTGLRCTLRHYQEWGVKYILHQKKVLLGDEMGLGKTVQAIAAMVALRNTGCTHFLVICPASVLVNWVREIEKHSDLKAIRVHGPDRIGEERRWKAEGGVAVTTYETAGSIRPEGHSFRIAELVVDEAHYVKNPETSRAVQVKRIAACADRILLMTGTALENRVDEMLELIRLLDPSLAEKGSQMSFMATAPQFRELIAAVYYRRKREDVLTEMPEKTEVDAWCSLGRKEKKRYALSLEGGSFMNVRRVSWNVDDLKDSAKAERLSEILEEAADEGRKVLVFSFFLETIAKIQKYCGDRCLGPINGSVPPLRRQQILDEFEKAPAGAVLLAQIQAGGTGLNIQSASVVVICEPQIKPSLETQAISRAYRMGQARNVLVYRLLAENTVDEHIVDILKEKQDEFDVFADLSEAAFDSMEVDEKTYGTIINAEIERMKAEQENTETEDDD